MVDVVLSGDHSLSKGDFLVTDKKSFQGVVDKLAMKLDGTPWHINYVEPTDLQHVREVIDNMAHGYIQVVIHLAKDAFQKLTRERPTLVKEEISTYDKYLQLLYTSTTIRFDPEAKSALFYRLFGALDPIAETISLINRYHQKDSMTLPELNKYVLDVRRTSAADVLRAYFTGAAYRRESIERFTDFLGHKVAFYSLRKALYKLVNEKAAYIKGEDQGRLAESATVYEINYLVYLFTEHHLVDPRVIFEIYEYTRGENNNS